MVEKKIFRAPSGTRDILAPESYRWQKLISIFSHIVESANYGLVINPLFEEVGVFTRGMGEASEVVKKEMYEFTDKGNRTLALRPEGTASVVRSFVQNRPVLPWKAWYVTPAFRYERPQAGRYRQHHQIGVEVIGIQDPDLDVEIVSLMSQLYQALGLSKIELKINSIGDEQCSFSYRQLLLEFLTQRQDELCEEHKQSYSYNSLRVLDCKKISCISLTEQAPKLLDNLCNDCYAHFDRFQSGLKSLGIEFKIDHRLVRGFDYYTRTTFEFVGLALDAAQNGIGGGGRYNGLVESLGGPSEAGIGFGIGIERLLLACDAEDVFQIKPSQIDIFVVDVTGGDQARDLTYRLRQAGLKADRAFGSKSMRSQLRLAHRLGAKAALIIGSEELEAKKVALRWLNQEILEDGVEKSQQLIDSSEIISYLKDLSEFH